MKKVHGWMLAAVLLCAVMVLGLMPGGVRTAEAASCNLWVGGEEVTDENLGDLSSKHWVYDPETTTLTLSGYSYTGAGYADSVYPFDAAIF